MSEVTLLPCPFCGAKDVSMSFWATPQSADPAGRFVECEECGASGPGVKINDPDARPSPEESAAEGWNGRAMTAARPVDDDVVEALDMLEYAAADFRLHKTPEMETELAIAQARARKIIVSRSAITALSGVDPTAKHE